VIVSDRSDFVKNERSLELHVQTAALEAAANPIVITDRAGEILWVNRAFTALTGYAASEALGRKPSLLKSGVHPQSFYREMWNTILGGQTWRGELVNRRKDGSLYTEEQTITPLRSKGGEISYFIAIKQDVTERNRAEKELARLLGREQAAHTEAEVLRSANVALTQTLSLDAVLQTLLDYLGQLVPYDTANVMLLQGNSEPVVAINASRGYERWTDPNRTKTITFDASKNVIFRSLITTGQSILIPDTLKDPNWERTVVSEHVRSWVGVPLVAGAKVIGLYSMDKAEPGFFTAEHVRLAETLATQAVIAIQNAQLYERVELYAAELEERIAQRKRAEEALQESEERMRLLLNSTAEAIYGLNLKGECTFCNSACLRLLGYEKPNELLGKNMHTLIHHTRLDGTPYPESECRILQAFRHGGGAHVNDEVLWRVDGSSFPAEYWSYPVWRKGELVGSVVTFLDISERCQLEAQFRQAQKMEAVGRLAGGVAHDFNNLLGVIIGYSEILLDRLGPNDQLYTNAQEIKKAGDRAASLTRQLLAFSRQQLLEPRVLDLNAVVASTEKLLRRLIGEDIELVVVPGGALGRVKADPGQIEQIIMNLAVNARDAMPKGGKLIIETANIELDEAYALQHRVVQPGRYVVLTMTDSGCGMDAETQAHIFEPFFTTKEVGKGTGLGLATVYGVVKQSGGYIWVYSEPGKGTTFKIYMPRVDELGEAEQRSETPAKMEHGSETILLVEDDAALRKLTCRSLEDSGYAVLTAESPTEAARISEEYEGLIHLMVTDVVMPGMDGRELADRLTPLRPEMKVLYVSGYTDDAIVYHGMLEPGLAFLQKPFSPKALARKVREVLDAGGLKPGAKQAGRRATLSRKQVR